MLTYKTVVLFFVLHLSITDRLYPA